jgi:Flp pilus assembly protein TadD
MKSLILSAIVLSLTGCAGPSGQQFMQSFGEGMQYHAQMQQQQAQQNQQNLQTYMQNNPVKRTDNQCFQACSQAGYQYGLCQSKCSY